MTKNSADAIIIGGGVIGTATGYYLARKGLKVYLFEKEYLTAGSTGRCIGGIRQQFSTETSINVAMEAMKKFRNLDEELEQDVEFHPGGYLFLAHSQDKENTYKKLIKLQNSMGLKVEYVDVPKIEKLVPGINTQDLLGGAYCASDAQANPFLIVDGYAKGIMKNGKVFTHTEVTQITVKNGMAHSITIENGDTYSAGIIVNAAGPLLKPVAKMAGINVPAEPERHEAMITEPMERFFDMMIVDYRPDGCYFNQKWGKGSIIGCYTPTPNVPGLDTGTSFAFAKEMGRRMARLIPRLKNVKIIRQWSGSYAMTPDGNPILDQTAIKNLWIVGGMCGHGFMLAPEIGWIAAEYMHTGKTPYDISEFSLQRDFKGKEVMK
jgi:sarcosine oxidase subunit beta